MGNYWIDLNEQGKEQRDENLIFSCEEDLANYCNRLLQQKAIANVEFLGNTEIVETEGLSTLDFIREFITLSNATLPVNFFFTGNFSAIDYRKLAWR